MASRETPASLRRQARLVSGLYRKDLLRRADILERTAREQARLADHNERVRQSETATTTRRVSGVRIQKSRPFDPEAGRYRRGRQPEIARSEIRHPGWEGVPHDAPSRCPSCGLSTPDYGGYGRYICAVVSKHRPDTGCGYIFSGAMTPSEKHELDRRAPYGPPPVEWTRFQRTGERYPPVDPAYPDGYPVIDWVDVARRMAEDGHVEEARAILERA